MAKIKINNVSRKYVTGKNEEFYAIRNISLMFDDAGFVSIIGKSGSGKSTILNLISRLDSQTEGDVFFDGKDISKLKGKDKIDFYTNKIGILFQNYNLIETETVLMNVSLAGQIKGYGKQKSIELAKEKLKHVGIRENLFDKKASLLSGGEKQRVALARCLINEPDVILCDEPTGALDSNNSINVMKILKDYSLNRLVIMVSHNPQLVNKYSDRIISIKDGRIESDVNKNVQVKPLMCKKFTKKKYNWTNDISASNIKRRLGRNVFSFFALSISLISAFIAVGFSYGKDESISAATRKQFDYSSGTISKQEEVSKGSLISLTRSVRPKYEDIAKNKIITQNFDISVNFDAIFPPRPAIDYDGENIDELIMTPVYSFDKKHVDHTLLIDGYVPDNDSLDEMVINKKAFDILSSKIHKSPISESIRISNRVELTYVDFDGTYIADSFEFDRLVKITGVVGEMEYLQEPKIYYSYSALEELTKPYILPNLSTYIGNDITWFDRISDAEDFDSLTSFSYRIFLKEHTNNQTFSSEDFGGLTFSSTSLLIKESLMNFMEVAKYGILIFLIITILGTILIIGIMSFTSYSEDHKTSAILTCLGASNDEIKQIYLNESLLTGMISILFSLVSSFGLSYLINYIINNLTGLTNLISIPIYSFLNIPFLFPLLAIACGLLFSALVTIIPITFSKKISLKEELQAL